MESVNNIMMVYAYEKSKEFMRWKKELPYLNFKNEWNVKIIPPFGGAIIRFYIEYNNKHVSVYFDGYDSLGFMGEPYFEYYDGDDCYRYLMNESKEMMEDIARFLES